LAPVPLAVIWLGVPDRDNAPVLETLMEAALPVTRRLPLSIRLLVVMFNASAATAEDKESRLTVPPVMLKLPVEV
jgi:hypothetical protein